MIITKSVTINATSTTVEKDGAVPTVIAYFNANVSDIGTTNNMNIQNQALYDANKAQVRKDKADFDNAVYAVEDEQGV
ncbi:hypothetical protein KII95_08780 [Leuconostoc gelidum subsp. aenigmaticum]|uniref:hypothetical protein n=1 Tax=Leuconostoc gelidum TaxID=1244 RepID=UPI001CC340D5|nr:hypothetical protein [Leuconostoc gelidum]MBZ6004102.1 hypothetical protein [Leuconostoc gelidum subsp. aenigmaticum]